MSDNSKGSYAATPRREFEVFAAGSKRDLFSRIAMIGETDRNDNPFLPKLFPVSIREMTPSGLMKKPREVLIEPRGLTADGSNGVRWIVTGRFPKDSKTCIELPTQASRPGPLAKVENRVTSLSIHPTNCSTMGWAPSNASRSANPRSPVVRMSEVTLGMALRIVRSRSWKPRVPGASPRANSSRS